MKGGGVPCHGASRFIPLLAVLLPSLSVARPLLLSTLHPSPPPSKKPKNIVPAMSWLAQPSECHLSFQGETMVTALRSMC